MKELMNVRSVLFRPYVIKISLFLHFIIQVTKGNNFPVSLLLQDEQLRNNTNYPGIKLVLHSDYNANKMVKKGLTSLRSVHLYLSCFHLIITSISLTITASIFFNYNKILK